MDGKVIFLSRGYYTVVDEEDYALASRHKWSLVDKGKYKYAKTRRRVGGKQVCLSLHRLIVDAKKGQVVDHIDHNGLDNRRKNLRICTGSQNGWNSRKSVKAMKVGSLYKGVTWNKQSKKWMAQITKDHKKKHLGYFKSETKAALAYNEAAKELFGEFACLNEV